MRILLIEDEHKLANALKRALEREHYAVDVSYDGDDGCAMAMNEKYDLMIIDRMLPGSHDGLEIVKAMRDKKIHTPVLVLTAMNTVGDRITGLDSGADDYLTKPFALQELQARVRALLRRPEAHLGNILTVGDLELDTTTYEAKRAGQMIQLTAKEFALLEYLMRNPGRLLSKESIMNHVWDYDADILPNTVEVYIKYLREKIDKPFKKPLIHTARGFGYKISDV
ncbi:response regulator transcription factor [Candidatus Saccharibacteria bacterium]|nr:response regulator transcription factor [Candidatus Saccharibacteria bacterium]